MWPGLVGKEDGTDHPPISLDRMLELTAKAEVNGQKFEGIDCSCFIRTPIRTPRTTRCGRWPTKSPAWASLSDRSSPRLAGDGRRLGDGFRRGPQEFRPRRRKGLPDCRRAQEARRPEVRRDPDRLGRQGRRSGMPTRPATPRRSPPRSAKRPKWPDHGERLAAEGEICWAGMHSWKNMLDLLNEVGMPETVGFQADQAHTYLYLWATTPRSTRS
jgi:hypothetical protein